MPNFVSPALFIDFSRMPFPKVIEEIDYEALLKVYQDQVVAKKPALAAAVKLEQSPTNVILQAEAYGEMMVRARVNSAARALMLPFATGSDLEVLAAFWNVQRMTDPVTDEVESDDRLRRRTQLASEALSTAGSQGSYVYHALTADPTIHDATAHSPRPGRVDVRIMNAGADPTPTEAQLENVRYALNSPRIRPLTDMLHVGAPVVFETEIKAQISLYPGPSAGLVMQDISKALDRLRSRVNMLGRDLTRSAIIAACSPEGVHDVQLEAPAKDFIVTPAQLVRVTKANIQFLAGRQE